MSSLEDMKAEDLDGKGAPVVSLDEYRSAHPLRDPVLLTPRTAGTLLVSVLQQGVDNPEYRVVGVNDELCVEEFERTLAVVFSSPPQVRWRPLTIRYAGQDVEHEVTACGEDPLFVVLACPGDVLMMVREDGEGVSDVFQVAVVESFARDNGTPDVLCIGGDESTDTGVINAELTGQETAEKILAGVRPCFADLIERSGIFDFIPLLQALDLERPLAPSMEDGAVLAECRRLPCEHDAAGRDAALIQILCCAALVSEEMRQETVASTMGSIGWVNDDGSAMTWSDVDDLCPETLACLRQLGLLGASALAPVERIERARAILRRQP